MRNGLEGNGTFENYLKSLTAEELEVELRRHRSSSPEADAIRRFMAHNTTDEV